MKCVIHTDGGARGNPGPAAVGVVIEFENGEWGMENGEKKRTIEISKRIGETTNNVAEYTAVLEALQNLKSSLGKTRDRQIPMTNEEIKKNAIHFFLDSTLVVNQLNGIFKVKDAKMRELLALARILEQEVGGLISYTAVPRQQNTRADLLVNKALDEA